MTGILIADDHTLFRRGMEVALQSAGYEVARTVGDGEAALEAIAELDPEVVILDQRMPVRDGLATLRAMRRAGDWRPVVILAAEIEDKVLMGLMDCRANAILLKNGDEFRLFDAIKAVRSGSAFFDSGIIDRAFRFRRPAWDENLNEREVAICHAVCDGLSNSEIAERVGITVNTVKIYLHGIYSKVGVKNRHELALKVQEGQTALN